MPFDGSIKKKMCRDCGDDISHRYRSALLCYGCAIKAKKARQKTPARKAYARKYYIHNRQALLSRLRTRLYGAEAGMVEPDECEVCGKQGKINYDHDHFWGFFRGWLCLSCNRALGLVKDNPHILRALAAYLERNGYG